MNDFTTQQLLSEPNAILPLSILNIQDDSYGGGIVHSLNQKGYMQLIWILEGSGRRRSDGTTYDIEQNSLFCILPGKMPWLELDYNSHGIAIAFNPSLLYQVADPFDNLSDTHFFQSLANGPGLDLDRELAYELNEIVLKLLKESQHYFTMRFEMMNRYLRIMLILLTRAYEKQQPTCYSGMNLLVRKFMNLLETSFKEKKSVAHYAKELCVTPGYLNDVVKRHAGNSAGYFIRQRIVIEAKRRAIYTGSSMKEIAYFLGFDDLAHFSKFFKNACGMNFSDYKKKELMAYA